MGHDGAAVALDAVNEILGRIIGCYVEHGGRASPKKARWVEITLGLAIKAKGDRVIGVFNDFDVDGAAERWALWEKVKRIAEGKRDDA